MTRTVAISESVTIELEAETLWSFVANYTNDEQWRYGLVAMTPKPTGAPRVGTTVHEVVRKLGSTYVTDSTVTEVGPGFGYRFSGSGDSGGVDGGRCVVDNANRTATFTYDINLHLSGFNNVIAPAVRLLMARGLRSDLAALKRILERAA